MGAYFENVKKNFGFGCMRLSLIDGEVDLETTKKMVDTFLKNGFNYFDTADRGGSDSVELRGF